MKMSKPEAELLSMLEAEGIGPFEQEAVFAKPRRWRADFLFADAKPKLIVEVEGGTYSGGRHTRGNGFEKDAEKYNAATVMGFRILRFTPAMITSGYAIATIKAALQGD